MAIVLCPDCGKEQDNLNKFCRNCGADLSKVEVVEDLSKIELVEENIADSTEDSKVESINAPILKDETDSKDLTDSIVSENVEIKSEEKIDESEENSSAEKVENENVKKCSNCGTELDPNVKFCPNCGKSVDVSNKTNSIKFCPSCGEKLNSNAKFCHNCGANLNQSMFSSGATGNAIEKKTPILSVILSFIFPGLGQFYNGQGTKGLYFIILAIVSWILFIILIGVLLYILIWLWSIFDAYQSAEAINRGEVLKDTLF